MKSLLVALTALAACRDAMPAEPAVVVDAVYALPDGALAFWRDATVAGLTRVGLDGHEIWRRKLDAQRIQLPAHLDVYAGRIALTSFDSGSTQIESIDLATGKGWTTATAGPPHVEVLNPGLFIADTQLALVADRRRGDLQFALWPRSISSAERERSRALPFEPLRAVVRRDRIVMANATHRAAVAPDGTSAVHEHPSDHLCTAADSLWTMRDVDGGIDVFANLDRTAIRLATAPDVRLAWCAPHGNGHAFLFRAAEHDELWTVADGVARGPLVLGLEPEPVAPPPRELPRIIVVRRDADFAVFDITTQREVRRFTTLDREAAVFTVAGSWYVVSREDGIIAIDGATGETLATMPHHPTRS